MSARIVFELGLGFGCRVTLGLGLELGLGWVTHNRVFVFERGNAVRQHVVGAQCVRTEPKLLDLRAHKHIHTAS